MTKRMETEAHLDRKNNRLTVIVEHGAAQSFSRAVRPKAVKETAEIMYANGIPARTAVMASYFGIGYTRGTESLPNDGERVLSMFVTTW